MAFGDVWKDSLTELSGGQRSLLALSLVLALCKYKPAPIYILDEVDAALDLNHTQVSRQAAHVCLGVWIISVGRSLRGTTCGLSLQPTPRRPTGHGPMVDPHCHTPCHKVPT